MLTSRACSISDCGSLAVNQGAVYEMLASQTCPHLLRLCRVHAGCCLVVLADEQICVVVA